MGIGVDPGGRARHRPRDSPDGSDGAGPLPGKRVGFVGLGAMGTPIAANFLAAGQSLLVYDADAARQELFTSAHPDAVGAADLSAFADCDVVVLVLPNSDIVDRVTVGDGGLLARLRPGAVIVDMGSSVPARTRALADLAGNKGVSVVDAPVSGGVARARQADLAVMAGGDGAILASVRPLIEATAREVIHVGSVGAGHAAKALNNLLAAGGFVAAAEALLVGRRFGIDPATLLAVFNAGSGRNQSTETKYEKFVLSRTFDSGFTAALMRKDIGIALDLARSEGVPTRVGETVGAVWNDAVDDLEAGADQTEVMRHLERLSGVVLEGGVPADA
ncbi:3-hydroxyisobutyrate dehydrogenase (fragment) [Rhodococcus sp. RD6.2]|uniref:NAD(P)-dependent oxidoreductase n=1 Tax=Rhodococcus sp. RD6.2 TaxID=260936 RepID=UPI00063B0AEA